MLESLSEATIQNQLNISRDLVFIPFVIVVYDYLLTLDEEVSRYWGTRMTWGSALFYLNRYSTILGTLPVAVEFTLTTSDPAKHHPYPLPVSVQPYQLPCRCLGFHSYHSYFALFSQMLVAILLIARTYALYERNKVVLAVMISVTVGAIIVALVVLLLGGTRDTLDPRLELLGCPGATAHDDTTRAAIAWSGMLVFDVMIFLLTVFKALEHGIRGQNLFSPLGAVYFGIMVATNAGNIGTYTMGGPILSGVGTTLTNVMSSVVISRLMLNLRDPRILSAYHRRVRTDGTSTAGVNDDSETAAPMTTVWTTTTNPGGDDRDDRPREGTFFNRPRRSATMRDIEGGTGIALETLQLGGRRPVPDVVAEGEGNDDKSTTR
ncbi:hypothetical protein C8F01DRAFT_1339892 [Mycena amicta]|nr:hypothetical protein C8F01DRAFT_1339892 [Mycena amicta]